MGHSAGAKENLFCALRKGTCPCGNKYRIADTPAWAPYQAHHLLCVAEVTKFMGSSDTVLGAVRQTKWCINPKKNLLAMPVGGATIKFYCAQTVTGVSLANLLPPPWVAWPMHTTDHGLYNIEVDEALDDVAAAVNKNLAAHEDPSGGLAGQLDSLSDTFRELLAERGKRGGGSTHIAWKNGAQNPTSDWYEAFSMAECPTKITFPGSNFNATLAQKILDAMRTFASW